MEYKESELSQWFDLSVQKPWQEGVYEVRTKGSETIGSAYWNGSRFGYATISNRSKLSEHFNQAVAWKDDELDQWSIGIRSWRGLSSDQSPKPKKAGNRKVTRYVVMAAFYDCSMEALAVFSDKKLAQEREALVKKQYGVTDTGIQKIRFRTSEA